jgi:hypothetical protein
MATSVEAKIMEALFARVTPLALALGLPIVWPNIVFIPPASQKYLRVIFVPNVTNRVLIGSDDPHQRLGLLQVSVHWTKGAGESLVRDAAGAVAAQFPTDLVLPSGGLSTRITKRPHVSDIIVEDASVQIPVMIEWECWA